MARTQDVIIKYTHRGLRYEDGRLDRRARGRAVRDARRRRSAGQASPYVEIVLVDMRERELTIKGQEILTSDKVAVRVSIITQFRVVDPVAAVERGRRATRTASTATCSSPPGGRWRR